MTDQLPYHEQRRLRKAGLAPALPTKKEKKPLKRVSDKRAEQDRVEKERGTDSGMDLFFQSLRKGMAGKCLFCNGSTNKQDDDKFHFSLAHLMPKAIFRSVATVPEIIIELCFWNNSCHTNFDQGKITWEFIKDSKEWEIIREKLLVVLPMVAPEERKHKLYNRLIELVYGKDEKEF